MKYTKFIIKNFKGIESVVFDLDKSPDANIYTLVGLNESGKTTILEAMNIFNPIDKGLSALEIPGTTIHDYNSLIPISRRDNFNDTILVEVTLKLVDDDFDKINEHAINHTSFKKLKKIDSITYYRKFIYENSKFVNRDSRWTGFNGWHKSSEEEKYVHIGGDEYSTDNIELANYCRELIPAILYFPNFLFDFPSKVYLEAKEEPTNKEAFYIDLVQDILNSLDNNTEVKTHLIDRIKSSEESDKNNLDRLRQLMERKISDIIFEAWSRIFKRTFKDRRVVIKFGVDKGLAFLEFKIEAPDGTYQVAEKSLGFRWFFLFLLFTQFRPYRKNTPSNIIYLFDEPASNLHPYAQEQLLKSFEALVHNAKIVYTTHSHHLINSHWLESTYVVKNEGLVLENHESYSEKNTKITIEAYRDFVVKHPHNTAYFQPILDVLNYSPSNLELIPNCVFTEGKNDYYTLSYFQDIILSRKPVINIAPSTGSGNLDTLISLYIGWGKEFIILLDSDKEGKKQKKRYIEEFGNIVEARVFTFEDIDSSWKNYTMEKFFDPVEALQFQQVCYPATTVYNKTHFNRSMQENLINKRTFTFKQDTKDSLNKVLDFLKIKLKI